MHPATSKSRLILKYSSPATDGGTKRRETINTIDKPACTGLKCEEK
jgi:hypothetical protein